MKHDKIKLNPHVFQLQSQIPVNQFIGNLGQFAMSKEAQTKLAGLQRKIVGGGGNVMQAPAHSTVSSVNMNRLQPN